MNTPNIDMLMKVATPAAKAPPTNSPREDGDSFGNHLREAAESKVASEKPAAKEKPSEEQPITANAGQEQGSTATPDQETIPDEPLEATTGGESSDAVTDEVILSVAAGALVEAEVQVVPTEVVVEVPTEIAIEAPTEVAAETQPASEQLPDPLGVVDATENTTTYSKGENENDEKLIPIEPVLANVESAEVAKNGGLTSVVEAPKAAVAPKLTKPIVPDETTENEGGAEDSETNKNESVNVDAAVVEAIAKVVEAAPVTTESPTIETKAETPAPATQAPVSSVQNQSQPIQSQPAHAEAPAPHAEGESHMPTIDRARFVQRVANAFRSAQQNDGQIQMRLSPPELGSLKIEIAVRNGVLSANLEAETPDARRVLLDNLPALRQRLAEQDIRIEKFEVDIRQDGRQQQGQAEAQQQQAEQQSQRAAAQNRIRTTPAGEVITTPKTLLGKPAVAPNNSGLDVRV
jgi:flagellar hook-length control protein FliK